MSALSRGTNVVKPGQVIRECSRCTNWRAGPEWETLCAQCLADSSLPTLGTESGRLLPSQRAEIRNDIRAAQGHARSALQRVKNKDKKNSPPQSGTCSTCNKQVRLRNDGRAVSQLDDSGGTKCAGSGRSPIGGRPESSVKRQVPGDHVVGGGLPTLGRGRRRRAPG